MKCPFCDKEFKNIHGLKLHIKTVHDGSTCPVCGKKSTYLLLHMYQQAIRRKDKKHMEVFSLFFPISFVKELEKEGKFTNGVENA